MVMAGVSDLWDLTLWVICKQKKVLFRGASKKLIPNDSVHITGRLKLIDQ